MRLFILSFVLSLSFFVGVLLSGFLRLKTDIPSTEVIQNFESLITTKVFDCKNRLIAEFFEERRIPVPFDSIPDYLKQSILIVEDKRFYSHWGLDIIRLFGAFLYNLKSLSPRQGASTITQQLSRNMFLSPERSLVRKIKEAILALQLERTYSKNEILELYLNQVYFGQGVYGVQSAANIYFNKNVWELNLPECATIASLPKAPEFYSPYTNPQALLKRRNFFLELLYKTKRISKDQLASALKTPLNVVTLRPQKNEAPYFVEEIRKYLEEKYGYDFLYRSGAKIYTTVDLDLQRAANQSIENFLTKLEKDYRLKNPKTSFDSLFKRTKGQVIPEYLQGALVCLDPKTGHIKAMVGGRDFKQSPYNRAIQAKRQPGSAFKVFVYTSAIDNGFSPSDIEIDESLTLKVPGSKPYTPANFDNQFYGPMTLRKALYLSRNIIAVKVLSRLGPEIVADYARHMGIKEPLKPYYSLALGSCEVSLLEMTNAVGVLANEGRRTNPIMISKIIDRKNRILEENFTQEADILSPQTAYIVTEMLKSVIDQGTGYAIRLYGFDRPAAGKTGTTDDFTDAWFVGYTPSLACGVWVGYDKKMTIFHNAVGGAVAAPIWAEFMKSATKDLPYEDFPAPDSIISIRICDETGLLATLRCPKTRLEVFRIGKEPKEECLFHKQKIQRTDFEAPESKTYPGY